MSHTHAAAVHDVEATLLRLEKVASALQVPYPHWLGGEHVDQGPSYCRPCAEAKVAAGEAESVDGGWQQDNDGCCHCETCGCLLHYTLTDYGIEEELRHFNSQPAPCDVTPEVAYHLARVLEQHHYHPSVAALVPVVSQALDQLELLVGA